MRFFEHHDETGAWRASLSLAHMIPNWHPLFRQPVFDEGDEFDPLEGMDIAKIEMPGKKRNKNLLSNERK